MSAEYAADAVATIRSVTGSDIWKRALKARDTLTEVPYTYLKSMEPIPVLEPGVMDLVFKETDGWVIVDYKTTSRPKDALDDLKEHYRPQLEAYREAWERMGCGKVKEIGLYFVEHGEYVEL